MATSRLHELFEAGVSPWIDSVSREMLETGELARLMKEDSVVGVTSNPTIFQKALSTGDWYDEQLGELLKTEDDPTEIFLQLAMEDIRRACDLMKPVWEQTDGVDGYVSIEVDPTLAYDREATFEQAIRLHEEVDKQNVFVKIPATVPGLAAIEDCIAKGKIDQRDADLLARALRGRRRGVHPRARAARRRRRRPDERRVGRELLRLARRHRGRPAARRARRPGDAAAGEAGDREREARVPPLAGGVLRPALGVPRRQGRKARSAASGRRRRPRTPSTAT